MERKRSLISSELQNIANMGKDKWEEFSQDNSNDDDNFQPSGEDSGKIRIHCEKFDYVDKTQMHTTDVVLHLIEGF